MHEQRARRNDDERCVPFFGSASLVRWGMSSVCVRARVFGVSLLSAALLCAGLLCAAGCSLPRGALVPTDLADAGDRMDLGVVRDVGSLEDMATDLPDTFVRQDAFGFPDAYASPDTGTDTGCAEATRCEGDVLVECISGAFVRTDCTASGRACEIDACVMLCTPGATRCASGVADRCDTSGHWSGAASCPIGCAGTTCAALPTCSAYVAAGTITVGAAMTLDLCTGSRTALGVAGVTCEDATGRELMFTMDVAATQTITLDVRDADTGVAVDTIVYVRTACGTRTSEIACDDDQPCDPLDGVDDPCTMEGIQYGHSRVQHEYAPGRYYVFVDSIAFNSAMTRCGTVRLTASSP